MTTLLFVGLLQSGTNALTVASVDAATATLAAAAPPAYPVKVGPTGRYLVDRNGHPFLIAGESPQAMIGDLSLADAELFFANRQGHGFNTVWINLLCASYTGCNAIGSTFDGIVPFTVANDLSTPNEAYFARADQILQLAAKYGFLVLLDPAETGSWLTVLQSNGAAKCRAYGQYLGKRYANFDNIVWLHGNDYQTWGPANDQYTTAVALGIQDFDNRHLHTVELNFWVSSSTDDSQWVPLIQLNAAYTYNPVYVEVLKDYNLANILPVFMIESNYEFENNTGSTLGTPLVLRRQEYGSILSGATGQLYGNRYTWQFIAGWKTELDTPGAVQMAYVTALFGTRPWYALVPDQNHKVVTAGYGTFGAVDYVTAARTPDGKLVMAYVPTARTVTVDMTQLSGPLTARWYDPAGGSFTTIAGSPFANAGSTNFTTPGNNADGPGNQDWVLVLEVLRASTANPDFDGDAKADLGVYRASTGQWFVLRSSDGALQQVQWGMSGDVSVPGDYDGDGKADVAVYRPSNGVWYILRSSDGALQQVQWGVTGDVPVPRDYDGDGKADVAVYRPSNGVWYVLRSSDGALQQVQWGVGGDAPVPGDYDGDGKADVAVYRPSSGIWYVLRSSDGALQQTQWGASGDTLVPGDYDGDRKLDFAVYRPSTGIWYILRSSDGALQQAQWGMPGDVPAPRDFDGDGKADVAVYRPSSGVWYVLRSSDGALQQLQWGGASDRPLMP